MLIATIFGEMDNRRNGLCETDFGEMCRNLDHIFFLDA
jgi:hypothetical protein